MAKKKSKYDPTQDETLAEGTVESDKNGQVIQIKVVSHKGGEPKVQLARYFGTNDKHDKLGRVTLAEWGRICDKVDEMLLEAGLNF